MTKLHAASMSKRAGLAAAVLLTIVSVPAKPQSAESKAQSIEWQRHEFPLSESIWSIEAIDINSDRRLDLIAMGERKVFALRAPYWDQQLLFDSQEPKMLQNRKRASHDDYRGFALRNEGDSLRGKQVFFNEQRTACSRCHSIDGTHSKAGPDLFAVGDKFGRRELIDAVLSPSRTIAVGYSTTTIQTDSGDEFQGIIKQATDDFVDLADALSTRVRISTSTILRQSTSDVSLMPDELHAGVTLQEFTDLIDFLVSLKQPENSERVYHAMPRTIAHTTIPVTFDPFHSEELAFAHPVWLGQVPGEPDAFLVLEHETGHIWRLEKRAGGDRKTLFGELGAFDKGTRGSLGLALHPNFRENRKYFFAKHIVENGRFATVIGEREAASDGLHDSGKPSRVILKFDATTNVHYGGGLEFGPDGYFYIGMGDTGPQEDPHGHGQDTQLLLGKMLRIDVDRHDAGRAYAIPADNPFVNRGDMRPEIWALGFREPWRFSFDPLTKDLWVGDVGQDRYEEIDIVRAGENHGWNVYEGVEPFSNRYRRPGEIYVAPIFAYARKYGISVTGGFVYRGATSSPFYGVYVFGDYESRRLWGLTQHSRVLKTVRQIGASPQRIVSFARSKNEDLFLVGYEGTIYKLNFANATFD